MNPKFGSFLSSFGFALVILGVLSPTLLAKDFPAVTDLDTALKTGAAEQKLVFIKFGRPTCGNCNALQELVDSKKLRLPEAKYVFANINCDDAVQKKAFYSRYKVSGDTLPFVVITDSEGKLLASRTGYGTEKDFEDLLKEAGKAARKTEPAQNP